MFKKITVSALVVADVKAAIQERAHAVARTLASLHGELRRRGMHARTKLTLRLAKGCCLELRRREAKVGLGPVDAVGKATTLSAQFALAVALPGRRESVASVSGITGHLVWRRILPLRAPIVGGGHTRHSGGTQVKSRRSNVVAEM